MKNKIVLFFTMFITIIFLTGCSDEKKEINNIEVNRTSLNISQLSDNSFNSAINENSNYSSEPINNITKNNTTTNSTTNKTTNNTIASKNSKKQSSKNASSEEVLSKFSTRIYSKDSSRQKNLKLTSTRLNGTIVKANTSFSFTQTLGPSTPQKGYEEADVFDADGNKVKGYGGGNCQISSTLYNAVLKVPTLQIIERHEHSNKVPYVKQGQDAAVAYGSVDFKFKNTNNFPIKILVDISNKYVTVKIIKI